MASRATLIARLATRQAQLEVAEASYTSLLSKLNRTYMFVSSGESQQATKIKLSEIKKEINDLITEIDDIENRLYGGGVVRFSSSRLK